ncbi:MAG: hypothetical protein Ta2G_05570 [Termitinemataceae bacterium]|nr:MAG: hypothetical protein Ta2G_05570 [Termitinemataceae bacterium]
MKRIISILIISQFCFAAGAQTVQVASVPQTRNSVGMDKKVGNNRYVSNSKQLIVLSKKSLANGSYDEAQRYAIEAVKSARLSDQYSGLVLQLSQLEKKITDARETIKNAELAGAAKSSPQQFSSAMQYYNAAVNAHNAKNWGDADQNIDKVHASLGSLGTKKTNTPPKTTASKNVLPNTTVSKTVALKTTESVQSVPVVSKTPAAKTNVDDKKNMPLPSQYMVRKWDTTGDCFWNIAERNWVYGDGHRWPILYSANKSKLEDPNNPHVIEPGIILDIPSINGEKREGMWDSGTIYTVK